MTTSRSGYVVLDRNLDGAVSSAPTTTAATITTTIITMMTTITKKLVYF